MFIFLACLEAQVLQCVYAIDSMIDQLACTHPLIVDMIFHFLAISPHGRSNQIGNTIRICFIKWHFYKMSIYKPMVKAGMTTLKMSRDNLAKEAVHALVDALEAFD